MNSLQTKMNGIRLYSIAKRLNSMPLSIENLNNLNNKQVNNAPPPASNVSKPPCLVCNDKKFVMCFCYNYMNNPEWQSLIYRNCKNCNNKRYLTCWICCN